MSVLKGPLLGPQVKYHVTDEPRGSIQISSSFVAQKPFWGKEMKMKRHSWRLPLSPELGHHKP